MTLCSRCNAQQSNSQPAAALYSSSQVQISGGAYPVKKMIRNVTDRGADQLMFKNEQAGRNMSVAEYFASTNR